MFKGEVYIQHLAVLKEMHERRMACLLKLNNKKKCVHSPRLTGSRCIKGDKNDVGRKVSEGA
jgi:hypothetical protein